MYILVNVPINTMNQTFVFREAESGVEVIVLRFEGEMAEGAGDGNGN